MKRGDGIKKISDFFVKYKQTLTPPQGAVINSFCETTHDLYGWNLNKKQISYNPATRTIHTTLPSVLKNEIKLKKTEIINHLKGRLGTKGAPKDII